MITIDNLSRRYGGFTALDDVSFTAAPGRITGFLGPNGAGKSTTMRILVGLTPATSGTALVNGRRFADLPNPGREIGVLLDASAQHAGRTGRDVLKVAALSMGLGVAVVDETLARVGLTEDEASRRVRHYSLGMRQRLGIGAALLGSPDVLVLDEPANGLDPAGIRWMREVLRDFADAGGTVLLSSHLLHEIEVVADDLVVIGQGRVVASGTKESLLAGSGTVARSRDPQVLAAALHRAGQHVTLTPDHAIHTDGSPESVGEIALAVGEVLLELRSGDSAGLEEMFLQLTAGSQREQAEVAA